MLSIFPHAVYGSIERYLIDLPHIEYNVLWKINLYSVIRKVKLRQSVYKNTIKFSRICQGMHNIRKSGGIRLTLGFWDNIIYRAIVFSIIQFIFGDYKNNDLLCGRMGGYLLTMKGLCCSCDIVPSDGDDFYIGVELKCIFYSINTIVGRAKGKLDQLSFYHIVNYFLKMSFSEYTRRIYGYTPIEIFHKV